MKTKPKTYLVVYLILGRALLMGLTASAQESPQGAEYRGDNIYYMGTSRALHSDISPPFRDIPPILVGPTKTDKDDPSPLTPCGPIDGIDPVAQTSLPKTLGDIPNAMPTPNVSFDAWANLCGGCAPPDPNGDVGPNHVVVMANSTIAVYSKTGTQLLSPRNINTLWTGFGGNCETENAGDPVVLYDQVADRWLVSQFTADGPTYYNCVCLSTSGDPTGSWQRYAFSNGSSFPDYPKYGIWRDGYYFSTRNTSGSTGQGAYALNRDEMLAGDLSPQVVNFLLTAGTTPYYGGDGLLPADMDGSTLPPAGSPQLFFGTMDNGGPYGAPQDAINVFKFHVDWTTPANSSFTRSATVPVAAFDSIFTPCGGGRACIPQPGTTNKIDTLSYRQRPTFRAAYRNFGTHESVALTQSVSGSDSGTSNAIAGMRWYELRDPNGTPAIYQQGTYVPGATDGTHRWMGSVAMDRVGNMGLGFSASSGTVYPSIWYTGRLATDPLGTMPQGEGSIVNGLGSQTGGGSRWGDYTSLNIDPVDDCTFWHFNEYYTSSSAATWQMRVGSFTFPNCLCALIPTAPTASALAPQDNRIAVSWNDSATATITQYFIFRSTVAGGPYAQIATVADTSPGVGGGAGYTYNDDTVSGGTRYYYTVKSNDGDRCTSPASSEVNALATGHCTLGPIFGGVTSVTNAGAATCGLNLAWAAGTSNCGDALTYSIYRSTTTPFAPDPTPGTGNRIASGLTGTSYADGENLVSGTAYYYIVRAYDAASGTEDANSVIAVGYPTGPGGGPQNLFSDNFETPANWSNWTVTTGPGPHTCGAFARVNTASQLPSGGAGYYALSDSDACGSGSTTSTALTSPVINCNIPNLASVTLDFNLYYRYYSGDDATCEVWNGSSWIPVWTDPNASVNAHQSIDVTAQAQGNASFKVRFNYQNASYDYWYAVDDVVLTGQVNNPCTTGGGCTAPGAPTLASVTGTCASVDLAWNPGSGTTSAYNVYRKSAPCGGSYSKIAGPVTGTSFSDSSAVAGTSYAYAIRGACDAGAITESPDSNCLAAARLTVPSPTVAGATANTCPSETVVLSTEGAFSDYQWYRNGSAIAGATSSTYSAPQSGDFTVSYTGANGCSGTSSPKTVTITPCITVVQFDSGLSPASTLVELCGNGDSVIEPGEKWFVTVRLKNTGNTDAHVVVGNLTVNAGSGAPAAVTGNPATFGTLAQGGGTGTASFLFEVGSGTLCVASLTFDVTGIASQESATYPSQIPAFSVPVGSVTPAQNESGTQQTTPLNASGSSATSNFTPAFTILSPDTATLSYSFSYTPTSTVSTLFSDEFTLDPASNGWTETGAVTSSTTAPTDTCAGGGTNYASIPGGSTTPGNSIRRVVDTTGKTAITLVMDYYYSGMDNGEGIFVDYSTAGLNGTFTNLWSKTSASNNSSTVWADDCARTIVFPSTCENNANFAVRIRSSGNQLAEVSRVDHLRVEGATAGTESFTANARVELLDGANAATVLKDFGTVDANPYNVKTSYSGPGTYKIRLTENAGGTATLTGGALNVVKNAVTHCTVASCSGAPNPKEASPAGAPMTGTRGAGSSVSVTYAPACGATDHAIFWGAGPISGGVNWTSVSCGEGVSGSASFDPGTPASSAWLYFVVVGQTTTREGSYGQTFNGTTYAERPEAVGVGTCDRARDLTGTCP